MFFAEKIGLRTVGDVVGPDDLLEQVGDILLRHPKSMREFMTLRARCGRPTSSAPANSSRPEDLLRTAAKTSITMGKTAFLSMASSVFEDELSKKAVRPGSLYFERQMAADAKRKARAKERRAERKKSGTGSPRPGGTRECRHGGGLPSRKRALRKAGRPP